MMNSIVSRWDQLTDAGRRFLAQGDDAQAETAFRAAVDEAEQLGGDHTRLAASIESLAQLEYRRQAPAAAEELYRRALALRDDALGPEHAGAAATLNSIAALCAARGAHDEAEALLTRALDAAERQGTSGQRELAATLNTLARLYFKQGKYTSVEPLLLRLLSIKQELGRDHPEVATVLTSLAALRGVLGRHDHAEQLLRKALAIRERAEPPNPMAIATLKTKLADAVAAQGRAGEAATLRAQPHPVAAFATQVPAMPTVATTPAAASAEPTEMAPHAEQAGAPRSGVDAAARPDTPRGVSGASTPTSNNGATLFAAAAALALDGLNTPRGTSTSRQMPVTPLAPLWRAPAEAAPDAEPAGAPPAGAAGAPVSAAPRARSGGRTRLVAASMMAMLVAVAVLAGKVTASATGSAEAPPAAQPAEDLEIVDNGPEESLSDDPITPELSGDSIGRAPAPSARPAKASGTSGSVARRERAERRRAASGARDQEVVDLPAPVPRSIVVDTRALDATVEAKAKAAVRKPPVELPPIARPQGLRPPPEGGQWNGRPPR